MTKKDRIDNAKVKQPTKGGDESPSSSEEFIEGEIGSNPLEYMLDFFQRRLYERRLERSTFFWKGFSYGY